MLKQYLLLIFALLSWTLVLLSFEGEEFRNLIPLGSAMGLGVSIFNWKLAQNFYERGERLQGRIFALSSFINLPLAVNAVWTVILFLAIRT